MKTNIISFFLSVLSLSVFSQDYDYKITSYSIDINKLTPEATQKINETVNKEKLRICILSQCSQADFDAVCKMAWIKTLQLSFGNEQITNINAISGLINLESLYIFKLWSSRKMPIDVTPLTKLNNLKWLEMRGTKIKNEEKLGILTQLTHLDLGFCDISTIDFVAKLQKLKALDISGADHKFTNYKPIGALINLEELIIEENVQAHDSLMGPIGICKKLEQISFTYCDGVTNLSFLKNCTGLKVLKAATSGLANVDDIQFLTSLENIDFDECKITSIANIRYCTKLSDLRMEKVSVTDLSPLYACTSLISLKLSATVSEKQIADLKSKLADLNVSVID
jgi:Leucine-rich repeat (LRR) protein